MQTNEQVAGEAREKLIAGIEASMYSAAMRGKPVVTVVASPEFWKVALAALRAQPERGVEEDEDEQAARRIASARLAADTDGYGSVDIALQGGRRVLLSLDAPHPAKDEGEGHG